MISRGLAVLLIALTAAAAGCSGKNDRSGGGTTPPPPASYTAAVTGVDVVNKDTGEAVVVVGLPAQGGQLNVR